MGHAMYIHPVMFAISIVISMSLGYFVCWCMDAYVLPWYHSRKLRREEDRAFKKIVQMYDHEDTGEHKIINHDA